MRGCEIDTIAEFDESFAFQADFDVSKTMKTRCLGSTALCFRAVLARFKRDNMWEFDESFAFHADFGMPKRANNNDFVDSIVFQACFGRVQLG